MRKHNLRVLRHVVTVVPQELFLFAASVHENIPRNGATEATFSSITFVAFILI